PLSPKGSFDLHVLGMPPAFVLSQDQTLKLTWRKKTPKPTQSLFLSRTQQKAGSDALKAQAPSKHKAHPPPAPLFQINNVKEQGQDAAADWGDKKHTEAISRTAPSVLIELI